MDSARRRGAQIYAEIAGYGLSCDAHHITGPHPEGRGAARAIQNALIGSGIAMEEVGYISAHGTGTKANDRVETLAIKTVFGERAKQIPVSSIKSMMGHTMGAASALEAVASALALSKEIIPPTINYFEPDPECDLDYVPNVAREHKAEAALSNSFAFGGNCAVLALRKWR
jgi:3-oxoacyl-[acyl-carrier-protein] synthase II